MYNLVRLPGQSAGFLGARHEPFQFDSDPSRGDFRVEGLELPENVPPSRLEGRRRLLDRVDDESSEGELRRRREQALDLVYSPRLRRAIALQREDPRIRARYGENKHGQSLLLARRLVEAGVRYVAVYDHQVNGQLVNWDAHSDIYPRLRNDLVPPADRAFAALVEDLEARGLLDSTLVVALGEFGRTPKINASAGRDHWPYCFNAVLAGGGIRGGSVHGASDKVGVYPDRDPTTPADLAATVLHRFGLDPESELTDLSDRPYRLAEGRPRVDWFA
jgi:hypothetical protein